MSRLTVVVIALVASMAINVYLFVTRQSGKSEAPTSTDKTRSGQTPTVAQHPASPLADAGASAESATFRYRDLDRATLERRLADAEARIVTLLPPAERFKLGEPNPANEERLRPHLDRIFKAKAGEEPPYELECRGDICHLTTTVEQGEWTERFHQDEELSGTFDGIEFGDTTYMIIAERGKAAGVRLQRRVLRSLYEGDASRLIGECKRNNSTPAGTLTVVVSLDLGARKLLVTVDGELAKQAVGVCVRHVVEDAMGRIEVPAEATVMQEAPLQISVP